MLKIKNPTIGLTAIIFSCIICFVAVLVLIPPAEENNPNNNNSSSSQTDSSNTSVSTSLTIDRRFEYAGIKDNGVIALFGEDQPEFAAELDNKNWSQLKWSPDGKYISVLGEETDGSKLDLFLYEISTATWDVITPYAQTQAGISGYVWENAQNILFTQGPVGNNWVHRYDLQQAELRKLFEVNGVIVDYKEGDILISQKAEDNDYVVSWYNLEGNVKYVFDGREIELIDTILFAHFAPEPNSFILYGQKSNGAETEFTSLWATLVSSEAGSEFEYTSLPGAIELEDAEEQDFITLCSKDGQYYLYDQANPDSVNIYKLDPQTNNLNLVYTNILSNQLSIGPNSFNCYEQGLLFRLVSSDANTSRAAWLNIADSQGQEVVEGLDYVELKGR